MPDAPIPFNRPSVAGDEIRCVLDAVRTAHLAGDGGYTAKCHALLENTLGVPKALLTTSCTHALEMAALLLNVSPDDEVILPAFTFVSVANAFVLRGAKPVFADIRPDTLNLDEAGLERLITPRTKVIVAMHYAGVACEMDAILEVAARQRIAVVEDNAHGLFGRYRGRLLGTFGCLATQSFHETKNFTCGEGGALLINDRSLIERAEIVREKGTNRSRFFRGQIDKYTWVDVGSSYLPSEILAAFLYAQLEARDLIEKKRRKIWDYYADELRDWAGAHNVRLPSVPAHCEPPAHIFYLLLPSLGHRQALIALLKAQGISSVFHYQPLHLSDMGRRFGGRPGDCPVTEDISERLLRLPLYQDLTDVDLARVVGAIQQFEVNAFRP
jgi:dTDP-4-amino-4,6-dideoxygalactose transaminase